LPKPESGKIGVLPPRELGFPIMAKKTKEADEKQDETSGGSIAVNDAWTGLLAISLLALVTGTGFLAWDWYQYNSEQLPVVPKLTGTAPAGPPKADPPKKEEPKEAEKKDQ
jgi:hypothetical protein